MPEGASEDIRVLATTVELGFQNLSDKLAQHVDEDQRRSDKIDQRLDQGAETMNDISADVKVIISRLNTPGSIQGRGRSEDTSRATPALTPNQPSTDKDKRIPWWARDMVRAVITVVVTGLVVLLLEHGAAIAHAFAGGGH